MIKRLSLCFLIVFLPSMSMSKELPKASPQSKKVVIQKVPESSVQPLDTEAPKVRGKQKVKKEPIMIPSNRKPNKMDYKNTAGKSMPSWMPLWYGVYFKNYKLSGGIDG